MDARRRHKAPRLEIEDFIPHGKAVAKESGCPPRFPVSQLSPG